MMNNRQLFGPLFLPGLILWSFASAAAQTPPGAVSAVEAPAWVKPPIQAINVSHHTFPSRFAGGPVSYLIYLPSSYQASGKRYPVMYWLHGRGGSQQGIPGFAQRLTKAIEEGKAPPMIAVFVNGLPQGGYRDSQDGRQPVESVTIRELIPHIDSTYRTVATREGRLVEGFSMGGSGAAKWGFKFADIFGSIGILAGALHGRGSPSPLPAGLALTARDDPWALAEEYAERVRGRTSIRIIVGSKDGLVKSNTAFHELLDRLGIDHQFEVIEGVGHTPWPLYDALGDNCWAFYSKAFRMEK